MTFDTVYKADLRRAFEMEIKDAKKINHPWFRMFRASILKSAILNESDCLYQQDAKNMLVELNDIIDEAQYQIDNEHIE